MTGQIKTEVLFKRYMFNIFSIFCRHRCFVSCRTAETLKIIKYSIRIDLRRAFEAMDRKMPMIKFQVVGGEGTVYE